MKAACVLASILLLGVALAAHANDFYIDPVNGSDAGDGSASNPWRSLQALFDDGLIETQDWPDYPYQDGMQLVTINAAAATPSQVRNFMISSSSDAIAMSRPHRGEAGCETHAGHGMHGQRQAEESLLGRDNARRDGSASGESPAPRWESSRCLRVHCRGTADAASDLHSSSDSPAGWPASFGRS